MSKANERKSENQKRNTEITQKAEATIQSAIFENEPSKQYVRRYGWLDIIQSYYRRMIELGITRSLKFLTLPGRNASDIGLLWKSGLVQRDNDGKINVAICDKEHASLVQANLANLGSLLASSGKNLNIALCEDQNLISFFPFDVINLDFCNQLFDYNFQKNLESLQKIFWLQRGQAFLLLLTTRAEPNLDKDFAKGIIKINMEFDLFRRAYIQRYGGDNPELCMHDYVAFAQILFPKIVAKFARKSGYQVHELFVANYERREGQYSMVCQSFEFTPLDRYKESLIYLPNDKRPSWQNAIDETVYELPPSIMKQANNVYLEYITYIIDRDILNITTILRDDDQLMHELEREADSLKCWWNGVIDGAN